MLPNQKLYLNFLKHAGLYTFINSENTKRLSNYYLFLFYSALLSFAMVPISYTFYSMNREIFSLVSILIYMVPLYQVTLKLIVFFIYLKPIKSLTLIFEDNYLHCSQKLSANRKIFDKHLFATNQICYIYTFVCYVNIIFWLCMPIIRSTYIYKCSDCVNKVMEFIYPFDYSTSPVYEMIVLYEIIVMIVFFVILVSQDLLFVVFVSMFCGQINTIKSSIASLQQKSLNIVIRTDEFNTNTNTRYKNIVKPKLVCIYKVGANHNIVQSDNNSNDNTLPVFKWNDDDEIDTDISCIQRKCDEDQYKLLIEIIKDHQKLMIKSQQLLSVLNPVMNIQLLTSILGVCLITFKMSEMNSSDENMKPFLYLTYIYYLTTTLAELFLYCWFGSKLKEETESIHQSVYKCGWYMADKNFCQALLLLNLRCQRPVRLTAWKVFYMDLTVFIMVLRVSYSFYTLLSSISGT